MILAKARVIEGDNGHVRIGLTFPTGFDPEEVIEDSVRGNGNLVPHRVHYDTRKGSFSDIYREFEVIFSSHLLAREIGADGTLYVTGKFRRGLSFTSSVKGFPQAPTQG